MDQKQRKSMIYKTQPMAIYEVHPGSWMKHGWTRRELRKAFIIIVN